MSDAIQVGDSDKKYDEWAQRNAVLPTMISDPDFGPPADGMRLGRSVWNDKAQQWERASQPYRTRVSQTTLLVERKLQEMYDVEFHGEGGEEVQSLAEGTIKIMQAQEDNWAGALNIIFDDPVVESKESETDGSLTADAALKTDTEDGV
jgi:hypothetical protein